EGRVRVGWRRHDDDLGVGCCQRVTEARRREGNLESLGACGGLGRAAPDQRSDLEPGGAQRSHVRETAEVRAGADRPQCHRAGHTRPPWTWRERCFIVVRTVFWQDVAERGCRWNASY